MKAKNFVVPHDFTEVAYIALEHAIATARIVGAEINILHVISKAKDKEYADSKLDAIIARFSSDVKLIPHVRVGSIFEDIGEFANSTQADLIFMGTHGNHGWQKLTGSYALKVINSSAIPFIIVQEKSPKETGYDDIVVPLDLNKETRQKLAVVAELAAYFKSRVHLVLPKEKEEYARKKISENVAFANKFFKERDIEVTSTVKKGLQFDKEVIAHAKEMGADLIAFMNLNRNNLLGVVTAHPEISLLNNEAQIPTLIVNPISGIFYPG